jgi:hypothetical protein
MASSYRRGPVDSVLPSSCRRRSSEPQGSPRQRGVSDSQTALVHTLTAFAFATVLTALCVGATRCATIPATAPRADGQGCA